MAAEMDGGLAAVDLQRAVAWVVVQEGAIAGEFVLHIGELTAGAAGIDIVAPPHTQTHAISLRHRDTGRNDFDIEFVDLAGLEWLLLVVAVIRPERQRKLFVELAMRGPQPALSDCGVRVKRALK